jgi:Myb-like DNA-binding domain
MINKDSWTEEEDLTLEIKQAKLGNKWSEIAACLQGRSENSVKNRWNSAMRRKLHSIKMAISRFLQETSDYNKSIQAFQLRDLNEFDDDRTIIYRGPKMETHNAEGTPIFKGLATEIALTKLVTHNQAAAIVLSNASLFNGQEHVTQLISSTLKIPFPTRVSAVKILQNCDHFYSQYGTGKLVKNFQALTKKAKETKRGRQSKSIKIVDGGDEDETDFEDYLDSKPKSRKHKKAKGESEPITHNDQTLEAEQHHSNRRSSTRLRERGGRFQTTHSNEEDHDSSTGEAMPVIDSDNPLPEALEERPTHRVITTTLTPPTTNEQFLATLFTEETSESTETLANGNSKRQTLSKAVIAAKVVRAALSAVESGSSNFTTQFQAAASAYLNPTALTYSATTENLIETPERKKHKQKGRQAKRPKNHDHSEEFKQTSETELISGIFDGTITPDSSDMADLFLESSEYRLGGFIAPLPLVSSTSSKSISNQNLIVDEVKKPALFSYIFSPLCSPLASVSNQFMHVPAQAAHSLLSIKRHSDHWNESMGFQTLSKSDASNHRSSTMEHQSSLYSLISSLCMPQEVGFGASD